MIIHFNGSHSDYVLRCGFFKIFFAFEIEKLYYRKVLLLKKKKNCVKMYVKTIIGYCAVLGDFRPTYKL